MFHGVEELLRGCDVEDVAGGCGKWGRGREPGWCRELSVEECGGDPRHEGGGKMHGAARMVFEARGEGVAGRLEPLCGGGVAHDR